MIDIKNLSKSFGENHVLRNISEHINPGEKVVIVGPSGSGKSTFLRCLNLLEIPDEGVITFEGKEITGQDVDINKIRQSMGMVFQHFNLFPNMTVMKNITLAPVQTGFMKPEEANESALALLSRVGLTEKADAYPSSLSGGQKQRIAIARAVLKNAPILILDEATSAVDNETEALIQQAIDELSKSRTVIVIAHRLSTVMKADNIIVLEDGRIAEQGTHNGLLKLGGIYAKLCNVNSDRIKTEA